MFKFKKNIMFLFSFFFISSCLCNPPAFLKKYFWEKIESLKHRRKTNSRRSSLAKQYYHQEYGEEDVSSDFECDQRSDFRERSTSFVSSEYVNSEQEENGRGVNPLIKELKNCFKKTLMLQVNEKCFIEIITVEECLVCIQYFSNESIEISICYLNHLLDAMYDFFFERGSYSERRMRKYSRSDVKMIGQIIYDFLCSLNNEVILTEVLKHDFSKVLFWEQF